MLHTVVLSGPAHPRSPLLCCLQCRSMASHKRIPRVPRRGPTRPTRRSLFGPLDHEQLRAECQAALQKDLEEASCRWAFDFVSHQPLEGGVFHWEGIPCAQVPPMYRFARLGSASQGSAPQSLASQGSAPQGSAPQGSLTQESLTQESLTQESLTQESLTKESLPRDSALQDKSRAPGSLTKSAHCMPLGLSVTAGLSHCNGNRAHPGNKEQASGTPQRCAALLQKMEKMPVKDENGNRKRKQTNITEFYQAKRRLVATAWKSGAEILREH